MIKCPKCGGPLKTTTNNGVSIEECGNCGFVHNMATGEEKMLHIDDKSCCVKCPACGSKLRIRGDESNPVIHIGDIVACSFCNAEFAIPEKPDPSLTITLTCGQCSGKSKVPANKGKLSVNCPHCHAKFVHDTGVWPEKPPKAEQDYNYGYAQNTQAAASTNECYQCPKCGWTHPNTAALNEDLAARTQCQSCGNSYLVHLTWDD